MSEPMMWLLVRGVWETLAMTFVSGFFGFVIGLPVGVLLYVTRPGQIIANAKLYRTVLDVVDQGTVYAGRRWRRYRLCSMLRLAEHSR